jgi:hypothetical protein
MSDLKWEEQFVNAGCAPHIAVLEPMKLFVQPIYADGFKYKGIIQHPDWTMTLNKRWADLNKAKDAVEHMANKLHGLEMNDA